VETLDHVDLRELRGQLAHKGPMVRLCQHQHQLREVSQGHRDPQGLMGALVDLVDPDLLDLLGLRVLLDLLGFRELRVTLELQEIM